jgi:hypothetical protein
MLEIFHTDPPLFDGNGLWKISPSFTYTVGLLFCYIKNERHSLNRPDDGITRRWKRICFALRNRLSYNKTNFACQNIFSRPFGKALHGKKQAGKH